MARNWIVPLIGLSVAAALAGSATAADKPTIGVLLKNVKDPFWSFVEQGAKDAANAVGADVFVLASNSDADVGPQLDICNTMIQRKMDAMIVAAVTPTGLLPCLAEASKKGVVILDVDSNLIQDQAAAAGVNVANSVGSDNFQAGAIAAQYLADHLKSGKVVVIEGAPGSLPAIGRRDGFTQTLEKVAPDIKIVASLNANWDRSQAANIATDSLTRNPDLNAFFAASDEMALAAAEAARAAGRDDVITIGVDGMPDALKAIRQGRMTATAAQLPYLFGLRSVEMAKDILDGKTFTPWKQAVPVFAIDKDVLEANTEPLLKYVQQR